MIYAIEPVPKPRMTQRDKWAKRPCVQRYRAFRDKVRYSRVTLPEGARVTFWLPMPNSWPPSRRAAMGGQPHRQKPDIDNLAKALLDAVYDDDSGVAALRVEKRWGARGAIEITKGNP